MSNFSESQYDISARGTEQIAYIQQQAQQAQQALQEIRGQGTIAGSIWVDVNAQGHLINLALTAEALRNNPDKLAQLIVTAYQQAVAQSSQAAQHIMNQFANDPIIAPTVKNLPGFHQAQSDPVAPTAQQDYAPDDDDEWPMRSVFEPGFPPR
ncbi:MAG: YbaB/EbfC family nucleoid-associated protein [Mycobacteriaceae bacterium]